MSVIKKIINLSLIGLLCIVAFSCSDDNLFGKLFGSDNNELPVEISFVFPQMEGTRAISNPKTQFSGNDIIHVSGTFTLSSIGSNGLPETETRYGAFYFNNQSKQWVPVQGSGLTWPITAVSGVFEAYYVSSVYDPTNPDQSAGGLLTTNGDLTYMLSNLKTDSDPLHAATPSGSSVTYGNAVRMNFQHLCTYLTLEDIRPIYSSLFYFSTPGKLKPESTSTDAEAHDFHNAFTLSLNPDNTLSFEFVSKPDAEGHVSVASPTVTNNSTGLLTVNFFLEPGYYEAFNLSYPSSVDNTAYPYLYYQYTDAPGNTPPQLNAGVAYNLNIMNSPGVTIDRKPEEGEAQWDETGDAVKVHVDPFLTCVREGKEYSYYDTPILVKGDNGLRLVKNIDFQDTVYTVLKNGLQPDIPTGYQLDGGLHYIKNLGCPLISRNYGTIKNLGIDGVHASSILLNQYSTVNGNILDQSRKGSLCNWNQGLISNIRLKDVSITATVITDDDQDIENLGAVLGSNSGTLEAVRISGQINMTVNNNSADVDGVNCSLNIGGLVGQNVGTVYDVAALEGDFTIGITNNCKGKNGQSMGAYYIGGAVGYNTGYIRVVNLPAVTINSANSTCTKSFIGLVNGETTTSQGTTADIIMCNVANGQATAGVIDVIDNLDSGSYIGGIAGAVVPTTNGGIIRINDCMVVARTLDNSRATSTYAINSTGGCFGRIYNAYSGDLVVNTINLTLYNLFYPTSNANQKDVLYGTFAGLLPYGQTWNNFSGNNIIITNHSSVNKEVGANQLN